jgi:cytochrome c
MDHKIRCGRALAALIAFLSFAVGDGSAAAGDPKRGAQVFQACISCHSAQPGEHLTGPSLAHIWSRKAGTVEKFLRYSDALKAADIVWNEATLDKWLSDPAQLVPGTSMTFPGVRENKDRQDVIAYLRAVSEGKAPSAEPRRGGMMMQSGKVDLKKAPPAGQVVSISHCGDTYTVKTADGKTSKVWEFNLRFKTD